MFGVTDCFAAHSHSVVGKVENAGHSRMDEKKQSEMGRHRRNHRRGRKKSLGSFIGK